jgi:hypothetical protein
MAGFRKPGPWGFEERSPTPPEPRLPASAAYASVGPLGLDVAQAAAPAGEAPATGLVPFQVGGQRYRVHHPNQGVIAGDEIVVAGKDAQQILEQVAHIPELAGVVPSLQQVVSAQSGLILLRLRAPVAGASAAPAPEPAAPSKPPPRQVPKSWIEIEVVDDDGQPQEGYSYRLDLPDGRTLKGTLGSKGLITVHGIDPGSATLTLIENT